MGAAKAGPLHVALLRGINVGGKNKLPMAELVRIFERVGCSDVETYIQSGNVVFRADDELARRIPMLASKAIADRYGYRVPVAARSAAELRKVARSNPFLQDRTEDEGLYVAFLAGEPSAAQLRTLDPKRSLPDQFIVRGAEIYLRCPNGLARSKLTNKYFDTNLETTCTLRNWNTVLRLTQIATS